MNRYKTIKSSYPYEVVQDTTNTVTPYAVFIKTEYGFSQQLTKWYCYKGTAIRRYNDYLKNATKQILGI